MSESGHSRRDLIKAGVLGGLGLFCARALPSWAQSVPAAALPAMHSKRIPGSQEYLPVIGLGANYFGVSAPADLAARREVLTQLLALGGAIVDTAQSYGRSEAVLGQLIAELGIRDRLFLSTKTPLGGDNSPADAVIETSLRALRVQRIDLMQIHNLYRFDDFLPALRRAKEARRIRYLGVSVSALQLSELQGLLRKHRLDFIQVGYSLANRMAEPVLALAAERGVAVLAGEPFGGRQRADNIFARLAGRPLPDWAKDIDATSWAQVWLKYVAAHPAVTAVTAGTDQLSHLRDNLGAGRGRLPDAALRQEMARFWNRLRDRA